MPLKVKVFGQPHDYGCLPTCVQAVRDFYNERLTYEEASELCDEIQPEGGCEWLQTVATLSLSYDIEELNESPDETVNYDTLFRWVEQEGTPVICHIGMGHDKALKHAVVVTGVEAQEVEVVNPFPKFVGRVQSIPKDEYLARWQSQAFGAFRFVE